MSIRQEVQKFKEWAQALPVEDRSAKWECCYEDWYSFQTATVAFITESTPDKWTDVDVADLLLTIARDNEAEYLVDELSQDTVKLIALSERAIGSDEPDAKWQLAEKLGTLVTHKNEAESLLLRFINDRDE